MLPGLVIAGVKLVADDIAPALERHLLLRACRLLPTQDTSLARPAPWPPRLDGNGGRSQLWRRPWLDHRWAGRQPRTVSATVQSTSARQGSA